MPKRTISKIGASINSLSLLTSDFDYAIFSAGLNDEGQLGLGNTVTPQLELNKMLLPEGGFSGKPIDIVGQEFKYVIVLTDDGAIYGCGFNDRGQLGLGNTTTPQTTLVAMLAPSGGFSGKPIYVSVGYAHTLILTDNGSIYGCGWNNEGQLGLGNTTSPQTTLIAMPAPSGGFSGTPIMVSAGTGYSWVLTDDGTMYGCGLNNFGQLGLGNTVTPYTTLQEMLAPEGGFSGTPIKIKCGNVHGAVITNNGSLYACGYDANGECGRGSTSVTGRTRLAAINNPSGGFDGTPIDIWATHNHTHVLTNNGAVYGCGQNFWGVLGDGTTTNKSTLVKTDDPSGGFDGTPTEIFISTTNRYILTDTNALYGCGSNEAGQLLTGATSSRELTLLLMDTSELEYTLPFINAIGSKMPIELSKGGTNATSLSTQNGIIKYDGTRLSSSTTAKIDDDNIMTNTAQPAFLAYLNTEDTNVTGDGTIWALGSGTALTEVFDRNSDFNTNGTFTAPVTGLYSLRSNLILTPLTDVMTAGRSELITSNRRYYGDFKNAYTSGYTYIYASFQINVLADMDAGDTATVGVQIFNGAKIVGTYILDMACRFSGNLVC